MSKRKTFYYSTLQINLRVAGEANFKSEGGARKELLQELGGAGCSSAVILWRASPCGVAFAQILPILHNTLRTIDNLKKTIGSTNTSRL